MSDKVFTRITLQKDVSFDINSKASVGQFPRYVVNLSRSITGVTTEELISAITKTAASEAAAAKSAAASKTSAAASKTSETNSKTSETNSKTSETNSKASEVAAKKSETAAAGIVPELEKKIEGKIDKTSVVQTTGTSLTNILSQKASTDELNKKFDKAGGTIDGEVTVKSTQIVVESPSDYSGVMFKKKNGYYVNFETSPEINGVVNGVVNLINRDPKGNNLSIVSFPNKTGTAALTSDLSTKLDKIATNIKDKTDLDVFFLTADAGFYTASYNMINGVGATADYTWIPHGATTGVTKYGALMAQTISSTTSSSLLYIKYVNAGVWSNWSRLTDSAELDKKFDKTGGTIIGDNKSLGLRNAKPSQSLYMDFQDSAGKRTALIGFGGTDDVFTIINDKTNTKLRLRSEGVTVNDIPIMKVGDFGWGGIATPVSINDSDVELKIKTEATQVWRNQIDSKYAYRYATNMLVKASDTFWNMSVHNSTGNVSITAGLSHGIPSSQYKTNVLYGTANTTKDSNGNLKAASPIVKIYADDIVLNEESEGVELKKLHTGIYQLKGTLGMNSDPSWGGIHGGIVVPNDINGLQLVYADYDVLAVGQPHPFNGEIVPLEENGDIVVYTTYRKHSDLPQNIQRARLKTYPEFTKEVDGEIVELSAGELVDIPNGHWLDVRVQMPSNSIYNIRQAEQEELARIAAEKAEAEEARKAEEFRLSEIQRIKDEEEEAKRLELEREKLIEEEREEEIRLQKELEEQERLQKELEEQERLQKELEEQERLIEDISLEDRLKEQDDLVKNIGVEEIIVG